MSGVLHFGARLSPAEFATKWASNQRNEKAAAQEHFIDVCRMVGVETPNEADPTGESYAFEKGATKHGGGDGFADVWKRGHFAWEYKGKRKNLADAYDQLLLYREALENPPCLVVCDLDRFEVHTNFTGTKTNVHAFALKDLLAAPKEPLRILNAVMGDPARLRPSATREQVTEEAAAAFAALAKSIEARGHEPLRVAHFLNRLLFCLFAEDIGLLPRGVVTRLIETTRRNPTDFGAQLGDLFGKMAEKGGFFGSERIDWFNGGLFDSAEVIPLQVAEMAVLHSASQLDWSSVEPAILGTLFERGLDPAKRSQLGAVYTDRRSILRVVEPVVLAPLRREFDAMKTALLRTLKSGDRKARVKAHGILRSFLERLRSVRILDPACGSGNFLYVALQLVKDLEKDAIVWGAQALGQTHEFPGVGPEIVHGIETNAYAAELARVTVWIGEIQWMISNGFGYRTEPILKKLDTIEQRDAIVDIADPEKPRPARWPDAEFIVGNPPFLGGKRLREVLGNERVDALFKAWDGRVPREADLVAYWHEQARAQIESKGARRAGLLATQSIRQGANREVLARVKETGDIFLAWSDEPWVIEGNADVRVSIVGQDDGSEQERMLDGKRVDVIYADLKGGAAGLADITTARFLRENAGIIFMGTTKGGAFDVDENTAAALLAAPTNVNGRPNSDVVKPWVNGKAITARRPPKYIIDFGADMSEREAAKYEAPFEYVRANVRPERLQNNRAAYREKWWIHVEPRPLMRAALRKLSADRLIVTPRVATHRLFVYVPTSTIPDSRLYAFARADDFFFGVLHSRAHEAWSLATSSRHGVGNDPTYNAATCFAPFPFPWPLNMPEAELTKDEIRQRDAIATAAKALDAARARWLSPPELLKEQPPLAPGLSKRFAPKDAGAAAELKKRSLTDLYNTRPAWLDNAHRKLDEAVLAAYGWPADVSEPDLLARLLKLNRLRAAQSANERLLGSGPRSGALFKHLPLTLKPERGAAAAPPARRSSPALAAGEKSAAASGPRKPPKSAAPGGPKKHPGRRHA
jgi:type II restriction/modification system DNA methylase subunit YeeA